MHVNLKVEQFFLLFLLIIKINYNHFQFSTSCKVLKQVSVVYYNIIKEYLFFCLSASDFLLLSSFQHFG